MIFLSRQVNTTWYATDEHVSLLSYTPGLTQPGLSQPILGRSKEAIHLDVPVSTGNLNAVAVPESVSDRACLPCS